MFIILIYFKLKKFLSVINLYSILVNSATGLDFDLYDTSGFHRAFSNIDILFNLYKSSNPIGSTKYCNIGNAIISNIKDYYTADWDWLIVSFDFKKFLHNPNKFITTGHVYNGLIVMDILITECDQAMSNYPFGFLLKFF